MENIIEVHNLVKSFGNKLALKDVDFSVRKGETIGFLGPSGSGKTTTIKILTAQLAPTAGDVRVFGKPVHSLKDPAEMKRIGILTDNSGLYDRLTVADNLGLYADLYGTERKRIVDALEMVNLTGEEKKPVQKLSKGMKQRVTLARAILHKPDLLFLDEPTSALDPANTRDIHEGLKELNRAGTTIFLTTHDMEEAESLCDRVAFLDDGEIRLFDTPQNLRMLQGRPTISVLLKDRRTVTVEPDADGAAAIARFMESGELLTIHSNEPTLGDLFVQMTGRKLA
ncbi:ABC transporter ATP-binding protein [Edaphobacillus lindanitolerans]|uniref:ABC-2 type transport system ATP-binding protein n=1 Tax=Edaphobacillus lindanitolerans TaxID=550447 RepID=A0A1U7PLJ3_9BACI|nr:ABC transporter ATP-binding protein [Edaphobacillus lindanitolerans]SIT74249.1 ABC-2 type transport system ATP-binding protein [Edaphobacillus lindanitolerans]